MANTQPPIKSDDQSSICSTATPMEMSADDIDDDSFSLSLELCLLKEQNRNFPLAVAQDRCSKALSTQVSGKVKEILITARSVPAAVRSHLPPLASLDSEEYKVLRQLIEDVHVEVDDAAWMIVKFVKETKVANGILKVAVKESVGLLVRAIAELNAAKACKSIWNPKAMDAPLARLKAVLEQLSTHIEAEFTKLKKELDKHKASKMSALLRHITGTQQMVEGRSKLEEKKRNALADAEREIAQLQVQQAYLENLQQQTNARNKRLVDKIDSLGRMIQHSEGELQKVQAQSQDELRKLAQDFADRDKALRAAEEEKLQTLEAEAGLEKLWEKQDELFVQAMDQQTEAVENDGMVTKVLILMDESGHMIKSGTVSASRIAVNALANLRVHMPGGDSDRVTVIPFDYRTCTKVYNKPWNHAAFAKYCSDENPTFSQSVFVGKGYGSVMKNAMVEAASRLKDLTTGTQKVRTVLILVTSAQPGWGVETVADALDAATTLAQIGQDAGEFRAISLLLSNRGDAEVQLKPLMTRLNSQSPVTGGCLEHIHTMGSVCEIPEKVETIAQIVGKDNGHAMMTSKYLNNKLRRAEETIHNKELQVQVRMTHVWDRFQEKRDRTDQGRKAQQQELERDRGQLEETFKDAIQATNDDVKVLTEERRKAERQSTDLSYRIKDVQIQVDSAVKKRNDMDAIANAPKADGDTGASATPIADSIAENMDKIQKAFPNMNPKELEVILEAVVKHTMNASLVLTDTMNSFQELAIPVHGMIAELEVCQHEQLDHKVAFRWVMDCYRSKGLPLSANAIEDSNNWVKILHFTDPTCSKEVVTRVSKSIKLRELCFAVPKCDEKEALKKEEMDEKFILALADQDEELALKKLKWTSLAQQLTEIETHDASDDDDDSDEETSSKAQRVAKRAACRVLREKVRSLRKQVKALKDQLVMKVRTKMRAEFDLYNSAYRAVPHVYESVLLKTGLGTAELNLKRIYSYFNQDVLSFIEGVDDFYDSYLETAASNLQIEQGAQSNIDDSVAKRSTAMILDWAGTSLEQ